ncbi:MAG: histidinol-phosphatase [Clostridia bacterium]|nr:histidinol-phosphatase [Clostridia bacterium]
MRDFHVHSTYSDGVSTPEEIVLAAIDRSMDAIGFSDHSYTDFDLSYCMTKEKSQLYFEEITALKKKYAGRINIFCGIEQDFYSHPPAQPYDYVIGSVHYIKLGEEYVPIDCSPDYLIKAADKYFDGDIYCIVEQYYKTVAKLLDKTNADIIGHFDLITKFNRNGNLFDESAERYRRAASEALTALLKYDVPFEVNMGAISRGYRERPYPAAEWIETIKAGGGRFIFSSDCHDKDYLRYQFDRYEKEYFAEGFRHQSQPMNK